LRRAQRIWEKARNRTFSCDKAVGDSSAAIGLRDLSALEPSITVRLGPEILKSKYRYLIPRRDDAVPTDTLQGVRDLAMMRVFFLTGCRESASHQRLLGPVAAQGRGLGGDGAAAAAKPHWFMKCLKEPLARLANLQDKTRGFFFEGRFKSVAILDEESLLATCAYIDLNPVAAGIARAPETSKHTSVKERVDHVKAQRRTADLKAARGGSLAGRKASAGLEESHWLCPIEDRRRLDSAREGMLEGFSLGSYLLLVDYSARLFREGKARISREAAEIFERIGTTAETWQARLAKLSEGRLLGRFRAASRQRLREVAQRLGLRRAVNLASCLVT
jgi:hypothetical protein